MPADLDTFRAFVAAITGEKVGLTDVLGDLKEVTKADLEELADELEQLREQAEDTDYANAVAGDLREYVVARSDAGEAVDPQLVRILNQEDGSDIDPGFLATARAGLMALGLDQVSDEAIEAFLELLDSYAATQQAADAPAPQQVVQQAAPVARVEPTPRHAVPQAQVKPIVVPRPPGSLPFIGMPTPANPPPFRERTAEEVLGLTKNPRTGKFDSGDVG